MAEIEIRIAIDAASQSSVLPIYVVSTPKTLDERVTFAQSSQPSQAAKAKPKNRHVRALKQPLVAATEKNHPHRTGLNAPKLEKPQCCLARQVGKYDRRKAESVRWRERGRIAIAPLAGAAGAAAAEMATSSNPHSGWDTHSAIPRGGWAGIVEIAVYCLSR